MSICLNNLADVLPASILSYYESLNHQELADHLIYLYSNLGTLLANDTSSETSSTSSLPSLLIAPQIAPELGLLGENYVQSILQSRFNVERVASTPYSADLSVTTTWGRILIEVKNYTSPVPTKEIEKFRRDMSLQPTIGGLFISLNTPIAKMSGIINFENLWSSSELMVYLQTSDAELILSTIDMIINYANKQLVAELDREYITEIIEEISDYNTQLSHGGKLLYDLKTSMNRDMDKLATILSETEMNIRRLVRRAKISMMPTIEATYDTIDLEELFATPDRAPGLLSSIRYQEIIIRLATTIGGTLKITTGREIIYDMNMKFKAIPLKTKITIGIFVDVPAIIPLEASYANNWVLFVFDKKNNPATSLFDFVSELL